MSGAGAEPFENLKHPKPNKTGSPKDFAQSPNAFEESGYPEENPFPNTHEHDYPENQCFEEDKKNFCPNSGPFPKKYASNTARKKNSDFFRRSNLNT